MAVEGNSAEEVVIDRTKLAAGMAISIAPVAAGTTTVAPFVTTEMAFAVAGSWGRPLAD